MLLRGVKRGLLGVAMAGLVFAGSAVSAAARAPDEATAARESRVQSLLKERVKLLRDRADRLRVQQKSGIVAPNMVWDADIRLYKAELELCKTDRERIAVQEKIVGVYKELEDYGRQLHQRGRGTQEVLDDYILNRLEAEIALERLREKAGASSK